ncbi:MAG TPA: 3-hydroxyacyl-ACP dehydratase FabZ [Burkholderiales bacterium]|jgi:3-hydroxyacyl-[acyl-carrier-protein] dehydratase
MDINKILDYLPHRYPMLLVDRVLSCEPGKRLSAIKNVTINEPFFQGHFPHHPVMPGVLIIEAMAQACAILTFHSESHRADERLVYYFVGIDNARFKKPVMPGDQLRLDVVLERQVRGIWKYTAQALVADAVVAVAEMMCTVRSLQEDGTTVPAPHT